MAKCKAVVFDIDGTLSPEISWQALTRGLGGSVERHLQIYADYKEGSIGYAAAKTTLIELWRATGNANKAFFEQLFGALPLDPAADAVVDAAKQGRLVCIITGSMDVYARIVAGKLGVERWYANTTLHWDKQGNLSDMDYELRQADKKLAQFSEFCSEYRLTAKDCLVVGNGENDELLFAASGHGVLVGVEPNVETHAWKRIAQLADLAAILHAE